MTEMISMAGEAAAASSWTARFGRSTGARVSLALAQTQPVGEYHLIDIMAA
jgi:hypothetical protein